MGIRGLVFGSALTRRSASRTALFRCSLSGSDADRWLKVLAWMFVPPLGVRQVRMAADAHVDLAALTALAALLQQALNDRIIEYPAFGRNRTLSRPESGRCPCNVRRSRRRRDAARRSRSTCSQENRR